MSGIMCTTDFCHLGRQTSTGTMSDVITLRIFDSAGAPVDPPDPHNGEALVLEIMRLEPQPPIRRLVVAVHLPEAGPLATLEGQTNALRAVCWNDLHVQLANARVWEAAPKNLASLSLDLQDYINRPSTEGLHAIWDVGDTAENAEQTKDREPDRRQDQSQQTTQKTAVRRIGTARREKARKSAADLGLEDQKAGAQKSAAELEHEEIRRQFAAIGYYPASESGGRDRQQTSGTQKEGNYHL
jgi:hypothetical protein